MYYMDETCFGEDAPKGLVVEVIKPNPLACKRCARYTPTLVISGICHPCKRMGEKNMNPYKVGDKVMYTPKGRRDGTVKYIACGSQHCTKENCGHVTKNKVWVQWPANGMTLFSYEYTELDPEINAQPTQPAPATKTPVMAAPTNKIADFSIPKAASIPKECKTTTTSFNMDSYNGITKKSGGGNLKPLDDKDIDWDVYHGFKKRKTGYGIR